MGNAVGSEDALVLLRDPNLQSLVMNEFTKPLDATDVTDIESAKAEAVRLRAIIDLVTVKHPRTVSCSVHSRRVLPCSARIPWLRLQPIVVCANVVCANIAFHA